MLRRVAVIAVALEQPPQTVLAELQADQRLAETWLRELTRASRERREKASQH